MNISGAVDYLEYRQLVDELNRINNSDELLDEKYIDDINKHFNIIGEPFMPDDIVYTKYVDSLIEFELSHTMIRDGDGWINEYRVINVGYYTGDDYE